MAEAKIVELRLEKALDIVSKVLEETTITEDIAWAILVSKVFDALKEK